MLTAQCILHTLPLFTCVHTHIPPLPHAHSGALSYQYRQLTDLLDQKRSEVDRMSKEYEAKLRAKEVCVCVCVCVWVCGCGWVCVCVHVYVVCGCVCVYGSVIAGLDVGM